MEYAYGTYERFSRDNPRYLVATSRSARRDRRLASAASVAALLYPPAVELLRHLLDLCL